MWLRFNMLFAKNCFDFVLMLQKFVGEIKAEISENKISLSEISVVARANESVGWIPFDSF